MTFVQTTACLLLCTGLVERRLARVLAELERQRPRLVRLRLGEQRCGLVLVFGLEPRRVRLCVGRVARLVGLLIGLARRLAGVAERLVHLGVGVVGGSQGLAQG